MVHELKILPRYFEAVLNKTKTWDLRKDDRGFQVGDLIRLHEFDGEKYTGRSMVKTIAYKFNDTGYGLEEGYCILSIE